MKKSYDLDADYQPASFSFNDEKLVAEIVARYPEGQARSAVMPLLDLVQRQVAEEGAQAEHPYGGWISRAAMDEVAHIIGQPPVKVYEVATFYSMYNLQPVGKYLIQVCTTTPCWLCGSGPVLKVCEEYLGLHVGETTGDGYFTLMEVECLGACANAPMVQINDWYYEDLTEESMREILKSLQKDEIPPAGPQNGRRGSMSAEGPTSLEEHAKQAGVL
jgi:NADH-quinone oxidoreductase E subunit